MTAPVPMTAHKSWVAAVGGLLTVVVPLLLQVATYLPDPWPALIGGVIALATVLGVYKTPNKPVAPVAPPVAPPSQPPTGGYTNPWR
jgi:hypothetical protein